MTSTHTAESVHRLLRALLGSTWEERQQADLVLMVLRGEGAEGGEPAVRQLLDAGTDAFGDGADEYLQELAAFWMNTLARRPEGAEPADRGGGAWAIGRLGTPAVHEPLLLALLRDPHWMPRADAAGAAGLWREPSDELVTAVGRVVGDHGGPDGEAHDTALATLIGWAGAAAPAVDGVTAWLLDSLEYEPPRPELVWSVIEALGPAAVGLRSAVRAVMAAYGGDQPAGGDREPLTGEAPLADDAGVGPLASLLQRVGIDPWEPVPGTQSSADLAAMPEAIDHIKDWLRGGSP